MFELGIYLIYGSLFLGLLQIIMAIDEKRRELEARKRKRKYRNVKRVYENRKAA